MPPSVVSVADPTLCTQESSCPNRVRKSWNGIRASGRCLRPLGFAIGCSVNENGQKVSSLGAGKYFIMVADPGRHEFTVKTEAKDVLALEVEPDETQFAKCRMKMGLMVGRPDIAPSTEAEFRAAKGLKLVDADDMGPAPGALRPEELTAALAAPAPEPAETPAAAPAPAAPSSEAAPAS